MRPLCIVLLYGLCISTLASSFLPIDTHRNTISIRYQTNMQGWLIDVPNSFESDCVLPQISKQQLLSSDASNFFTCKQLTRQIYDTDYFIPDVIPHSSECLDFLLTLSTTLLAISMVCYELTKQCIRQYKFSIMPTNTNTTHSHYWKNVFDCELTVCPVIYFGR